MQEETYKTLPNGNKVTCAVIIQNEAGDILAVHPTGQKFDQNWSLPKGLALESEEDVSAASRELWEETTIDTLEEQLEDLGIYSYQKGKDIHLFRLKTGGIELEPLHCISTFERTDIPGIWMSEVDSYRWVGLDRWDKFSKGIREVLTKVLKSNS